MLAPGHACRPPPLLLETLLLLLLLLGALPGTGTDPAENPPQQVNGIRGGSVLFPLKFPPTAPVTRIEWSLRTRNGREIRIAELRDGKLECHGASGRFGQQLEMAGNFTLRIQALEKEHSGMLKARVLFATQEVHEETFHLSVFEPVPDPQIHHHVTSSTAEGCNVTLRCLASEPGWFNISWKRGDQLSVLEEGSGWHQLSAEVTDLHVLWRPDSSDPTITCLLSNLVDQKNVSLDLLHICPTEGHPRDMWFLLLPAILIPILAVGLGIYLWKKKSSRGAVPMISPEEEGSPALHYAELGKKRSPPEGDENQSRTSASKNMISKTEDPDRLSPCLEEIPMVATTPGTIYVTLQPPLTTPTLPGLGPTSTCVPCHSSVLG